MTFGPIVGPNVNTIFRTKRSRPSQRGSMASSVAISWSRLASVAARSGTGSRPAGCTSFTVGCTPSVTA
jgi:hypothetical protein